MHRISSAGSTSARDGNRAAVAAPVLTRRGSQALASTMRENSPSSSATGKSTRRAVVKILDESATTAAGHQNASSSTHSVAPLEQEPIVVASSVPTPAASAPAAAPSQLLADSFTPKHEDLQIVKLEAEKDEVLENHCEEDRHDEVFTARELKYFRKMFDMFDVDHSGAIGYYEMKNLAQHLGVQLSDDDLRSSMAAVDSNGNGELEFDEFMVWLSKVNDNSDGCGDEFAVLKSRIRAQGSRPLSTAQIEQFQEVFKHFDIDGSGTIDIHELGSVFESMGQHLSREELLDVLRQVDSDENGEIDFDEFLMLMCCNFGAVKTFESQLLEAFRRYDTDGDGLLTLRELRRMISELVGDAMTAAEISEAVDVASVDRGDGTVDYMQWGALWDACRGLL